MAKRKQPTRQAVGGFWPEERTRRAVISNEFIAEWGEVFPAILAIKPGDGAEPFWAEIRDDLTFADLERIPSPLGTQFADQWEVIAPWVTGWNATAVDMGTRERVAVPPPAEAGADAFKTQLPGITLFLNVSLKWHADLNLPKGPRRTDDTPAG